MSTQQYLIDAATRHQVFLQRYGGGQAKEALTVLNRLRRAINARLSQEPTVFQAQRLEAVLKDISALSIEAFHNISNQTIDGSKELAKSEAAFSAKLFDKATVNTEFTIPADTVLIANVMQSAMKANVNSAITIEEALRQFSEAKTKQIAQIISDGVVLGDTTPVIARNVGETINTLNRRQLDTLVRTITNHTSSVARKEIYSANSDIMDGYKWIATLDNRTTMICAGRDGVVYQDMTGSPVPPAHWGCRSTTIPVISPEFDIGAKLKGQRPAISAGGVEQVSGRTTYGGWLKKQPKDFVDEALGVERSKLFRSGKLAIDKFTDPTGRIYTLKELESLNPMALLE